MGMDAGANNTSTLEMRRPSVVSHEVDSVLKTLLPYGSGVPKVSLDSGVLEDALPTSDSEQFEIHHVNDAAEKHAYLHSQHGMEDVFWCTCCAGGYFAFVLACFVCSDPT